MRSGVAEAAVLATQLVSVKNGAWTDPSVWDGGRVPTANDRVLIKHAVTLTGTGQCQELKINGGKSLTFNNTVTTTLLSKRNIVVYGTFTCHPISPAVVHTVRVTNANEDLFTGGGNEVIDDDRGLWVMGSGRLDWIGSPRAGWNRTGDDPTWLATDELVAAPIEQGEGINVGPDYAFDGFTKGANVPEVVRASDGKVFKTEILNLTRNVRFEGVPGKRSHIFVLSAAQQIVKWVAIRYVGPRKNGTFVPGRYGLHFHMNMESQRGVVIEGVVVRDSGSHAFVAHMSHGMTFHDCIAYATYEDAYWWDPTPQFNYPDPPDPITNDTTYDHCAAMLVRSEPVYEGYRMSGFSLGEGYGNSCTDCVAVAVQGNVDSNGFGWREFGPWEHLGEWLPFADNIAHNNSCMGATVWQVNHNVHDIERFTAFHNGVAGVYNGAYANAYRWTGLDLWRNGGNANSTQPFTQFFAWTGAIQQGSVPSGLPWALMDSYIDADGASEEAVILAGRAVVELVFDNGGGDQAPGEVTGCTMLGYTRAAIGVRFDFHDFGPYKANWKASGNDYGPGTEFWFDEDGLGNHMNTTLVVPGIGTLHPFDFGMGTWHPEWNCFVT